MKIYFFSRHDVSNLMIEHLQEKLQSVEIVQFKGTISSIRKTNNGVTFQEIIEVNGEKNNQVQQIEFNPTIIAVCPLPMQIEWLNAGANLFIPQATKVPVGETGAEFVYTGLLHIKKIVVESEQWAGSAKSVEEVIEQRKLFVGS